MGLTTDKDCAGALKYDAGVACLVGLSGGLFPTEKHGFAARSDHRNARATAAKGVPFACRYSIFYSNRFFPLGYFKSDMRFGAVALRTLMEAIFCCGW